MGDTDGNNTLTYVLPDVIDPPGRLCVIVPVPDEKHHIMAFKGALWDLCYWWNWERDDSHKAAAVARVWRQIFYSLQFNQVCVPALHAGTEQELEMAIKVDCNCNVFVDCCDGTQKQLATTDMLKSSGQPGGGSPQPKPGGGQACYNFSMIASSKALLPTVVNTGDVITVTDWTGAVNKAGDILWGCPDGEIFAGGECGGSLPADATDPAPSLNHDSLIMLINGTYYQAPLGTTFTVPTVPASTTVTFLANLNPVAASGEFFYSVCVTNNKAVTWSHDLDLTASPHGFTTFNVPATNPSTTTWIPGTGFVGSGGGSGDDTFCAFVMPLSGAGTLTKVTPTCHQPGASSSQSTVCDVCLGDPILCDTFFAASAHLPASATDQDYPIALALGLQSTRVYCQLAQPGAPVGTVVCDKLHVEGTGFDPFA